MKNLFKCAALAAFVLVAFVSCEEDDSTVSDITIDFEDLTVGESGYWNGSDKSGSYSSGIASFNNNYNAEYSSWDGFAYSNLNDVETSGYTNMYSVFDKNNSGNTFAVFYYSTYSNPSYISFSKAVTMSSIKVCNSTYAALSMKNGNSYAKKFGGDTGDDADFLKITASGLNLDGTDTGKSVEFYLADYRSSNNSEDYIVDSWKKIDLSGLGEVGKVSFKIESSDVGEWGMNTPAYLMIDDITYLNK